MMTKTHRRLLYIAFSVLFVVLAPLLLLLGAGYRFAPGTWRLAPTGYIAVRTLQTPDRIILDGRSYDPDGKETRFANLVAGPHEVRIEKNGFFPWQRRVIVEPGVARAYSDIALVPSGPYPEVAANVTRLAAAPSGPWVALLRDERPFVVLSRAGSGAAFPVSASMKPVRDLLWSMRGDRFLAISEDGLSADVISVEQPAQIVAMITLSPAARLLGWDPITTENVLVEEDGVVQSVRPGEQIGTPRGTNVTAVSARQETLYLLEEGPLLHVVAPGVDRTYPLEDSFSATTIFLPSPRPYVTLLDAAQKTLTVLHGGDGRTVWRRHNVLTAAWRPEGRTLALGDGFETSFWDQLLWLHPAGFLLARHQDGVRLLETGAGIPVQVFDVLAGTRVTDAATRASTVWLLADGVVRAVIW